MINSRLAKCCSRKLLLVAALFVSCQMHAQEALVWQISPPNGNAKAWLMGTVHSYPEGVLQMDSAVLELLAQSKGLLLETQLTWKGLFGALIAPGGISSGISGGTMTPETEAAMRSFFVDGQGMEQDDFKQSLRNTIMPSMQVLSHKTYNATQNADGMEGQLRKAASRFNLPIKGLDTDLRQINRWLSYYDALQEASWQAQAADSAVARSFYALGNIYAAYGIQDSTELLLTGDNDEYRDGLSLVAWRNHNWMKLLPGYLDEGYFVAVGAAHLYGANGVLALLRQKGYTTTPVPSNFRGDNFWRFLQKFSAIYQLQ